MASLAAIAGIPEWAWLGIGGMLFFVALVAVLLSLRRRGPAARAEPGVVWDDAVLDAPAAPAAQPPAVTEVGWEDLPAQPDVHAEPPASVVEETGPVHHCRCPGCQTQFTVTGAKPIVTHCPGCGKKGYLR